MRDLRESGELLTNYEAARLVSVSVHTIRYWVKTGRLAAVARGAKNQSFFRRTDVLAASTRYRSQEMKKNEGDKNLITVNSVGAALGISRTAAYSLVTRLKPTKYHIGFGREYYVDGEEIYQLLSDNPYYKMLMAKKRFDLNQYF